MFSFLAVADWALENHGIQFLTHHWPRSAEALLQFNQSASESYDSIQNFLNTVVQLTGLFLTLYFTAISLIASAVYARVPGDVRTLAIDEKVGNVYIRVVAILGAISILYLVAGIVGIHIGLIGLAVVGALSIASLFSFLFLGKRTFNFFQPTAFVQYVVNDLAKWITLAAGAKRSTQTPSLQDYYRRRAETTLGTYRNIVSLATKEEFHRIEADALITLLQGTVDLAIFYADRKTAISSESLWFEKINKHAKWLTIGHVQLDMALRTGRPVDPELIPNFVWFEEWLETILYKTSSALTVRDDPRPWFKFANRLYYRLEKLARLFAVDEALLLFRSQWKQIESLLDNCALQPASGSDETSQQLSFYVGAIAFVFSDLMAISIGFAVRVEELTEESIRTLADDLLRDKPMVIYSSHLPRAVLSEGESISANLQAEKFVEGRIFTPQWYVSQMLARSFIEYFKGTCFQLVSEAEQVVGAKLDVYQSKDRYLFLAQITSSGIEMCDKLHTHLARIKQCVEMLNGFRRVQDIPWVDVDWKALHDRIAELHRRLMLAAAGILLRLDSLPSSRYWPDFFGQMYSFVAREAYLSMERGEDESFAKLFPPLFAASIAANQRLREELKDKDARTMLAWSTTPVQDIVELSGYAKLFSELDSKPFYDIVGKTWNTYLDTAGDASAVLKFITALLEYRVGSFFTAARDIERTTWQQSFERLLRDRGLLHDYWDYDRSPKTTHSSKLIQEFVKGGVRIGSASDVFLVDFVMPRLAGQEVKFPYTAKHLADALAREAAENAKEDQQE